MPRRSVDQGGKPFEFRTGIGGLPALGGMYRSGDPATIPPHKFHMLVNMRKTPGGLITRPGLELEFNTGVNECINGLTEDSGDQGGGLLLYPGAHTGASANPASFRAIFPGQSDDYSEYVFSLYGAAAATRATQSPVMAYSVVPGNINIWLSRPFLFQGHIVQFANVDRNGDTVVGLVAVDLPSRIKAQASICQRDTQGGGTGCVGLAGEVGGSDPTDPPLWPYQYPVGSSYVLTYFENPFTTGTWFPEASINPQITTPERSMEQILVIQERGDNPVSGDPGVGEVLYFIAWRDDAGTIKRKLIRWDGVNQTTEYNSIPDDTPLALTQTPYGPLLVSQTGGPEFGAYRKDDGAWAAITGMADFGSSGMTLIERAVTWGGKAHAIVWGTILCGMVTQAEVVHAYGYTPGDAGFDEDTGTQDYSARTCTPYYSCEESTTLNVYDAVVCGERLYVLLDASPLGCFVGIGDFTDPGSMVDRIKVSEVIGSAVPGRPQLWIQASGTSVYVGGYFEDWDPVAQALDNPHHGVYDITDPTAVFMVYRVYDTAQIGDAGDTEVDERYSLGALPTLPSDDNGGEGFSAT